MLPNRQTQVRFFSFIVVGGTGALVQFASLWLLKSVLPARIAYTIAFVLSVATHYSLNRFWALRSIRRDTFQQFLEYLATVAVSYVISFACFNLCYAVFHLGIMVSTALAIPPSTGVVFLLLNYRVFHHRTAEDAKD